MKNDVIVGVFVVGNKGESGLKILHRGIGDESMRDLFRIVLEHREDFGIKTSVTIDDLCRAFSDGGGDAVEKLMGYGCLEILEFDRWLLL